MRCLGVLMLLTGLLHCIAFAEPPAGTKWEPNPEFTDEFNGTALDNAKWDDHNPTWEGRPPGYFNPKNVDVKDGNLELWARTETLPGLKPEYKDFTTAAVKSKDTVLYGYFEVRCKPMKSHASSAFWFYNDGKELWTEIDVFEIGGGAPEHQNTYYMTLHVMRSPGDPSHRSSGDKWIAPYVLADEWHVYGFDWNEKQLVWYVDGKSVRTVENTLWHQELRLNFDSETMPEWFGLPTKEELPAVFQIDYLRAWKQTEEKKPTP